MIYVMNGVDRKLELQIMEFCRYIHRKFPPKSMVLQCPLGEKNTFIAVLIPLVHVDMKRGVHVCISSLICYESESG